MCYSIVWWYIAIQVRPKLEWTANWSTSKYANYITLPIFLSKIVICTLRNSAFTVPISAGPKTNIEMRPDILSNGWPEMSSSLRLSRYTTFCEKISGSAEWCACGLNGYSYLTVMGTHSSNRHEEQLRDSRPRFVSILVGEPTIRWPKWPGAITRWSTWPQNWPGVRPAFLSTAVYHCSSYL